MTDRRAEDGNGQVHIELVRDEILTTSSSISIRVPATADPNYVARAIGVPGQEGQVHRLPGEGEYVWSPRTKLRPGRYSFVVEALADAGAQRITEPLVIPFQVVATRAVIPAPLRVESYVRIRLLPGGFERLRTDALPEGDYVDVLKAADRRSGTPKRIGFDHDGRAVNAEQQVRDHQREVASANGKLHPVLAQSIETLAPAESVLVNAWLDIEEREPSILDRPFNLEQVPAVAERAKVERERIAERVREIAASLADGAQVINADRAAPAVTLRLPASSVRSLAERPEIVGLYLREDEGIDDLKDSIAIAGSAIVHADGQTGAGVNVAVWEDGPDPSPGIQALAFKAGMPTSLHSRNVHAIIRNRGTSGSQGHAPGCNLFSANDKATEGLTWAVKDQHCTVVNQSFHRSSEPLSDVLSDDDAYGDYLVLQWPFPLIVHAAGNLVDEGIEPPESEYVNHKGYNSLSVANHSDDGTFIDAYSAFRNPTTPFCDRELPEISANGTGVTADTILRTGTSQASPAVAGVAALLQATDQLLRYWPEATRAILFASAIRRASPGTWWQDVSSGVDAREGAGAVNAPEARAIAQSPTQRDFLPTRRGWDKGQLSIGDFDNDGLSLFSYQLVVPAFSDGSRNVKVALAWQSKCQQLPGSFYTSVLAVDLDLKVFDASGTQVGISASHDNSYEIAEFVGNAGESYSIRIRCWGHIEPTWYGIAWTVTGGSKPEVGLLERMLHRARGVLKRLSPGASRGNGARGRPGALAEAPVTRARQSVWSFFSRA